jgi:hypothetical protein
MAVRKQPIDAGRIRHIPAEGFSWIDRRFVRQGFAESLPPEAILLYFFLVAVSDREGLSFYAHPTISRILKLDHEELSQARARLIREGLILYEHPLYQVLPLPPRQKAGPHRDPPPRRDRAASPWPSSPQSGEPVSLSDLLTLALSKAQASQSEDEKTEDKK